MTRIGFDHFALPHDPMARATREGTLRRNFQGFTDDPSEVLIGMGSSAISGFPGLIAQNEKHNGRYRKLSTEGRLSACHGIARSPEDRLRGRRDRGTAVPGRSAIVALPDRRGYAIASYPSRRLGWPRFPAMSWQILPGGLPYARVIAALFDSYRAVTQRRFSSAI